MCACVCAELLMPFSYSKARKKTLSCVKFTITGALSRLYRLLTQYITYFYRFRFSQMPCHVCSCARVFVFVCPTPKASRSIYLGSRHQKKLCSNINFVFPFSFADLWHTVIFHSGNRRHHTHALLE